MTVQLTFNKTRDIFKTLGTLKQGNLKLRFQITASEFIVETESTAYRSTRAAAESVSLANAYNRDLSQFRAQITVKMQECVKEQLAQTGARKLDSQVVTDLTQEINLAIEGLRKLRDDQYQAAADKDKRKAIKQIIKEDFQPLINQINPSAAAMSSSGSASLPSLQRSAKENVPISVADIPAEVQRLRAEVGQLREEIDRLKKQSPSSSTRDTFLVILIAINVVVIAIHVVNFFQEG